MNARRHTSTNDRKQTRSAITAAELLCACMPMRKMQAIPVVIGKNDDEIPIRIDHRPVCMVRSGVMF